MRTLSLLSTALLFAAGAHAADPTTSDDTERKAVEDTHPHCLQHTGSRIKPSEDRPCINAAGQVISREQIEQTGAIDTAEALRRITPIVR
jgi:outer membrane cobalamin receptor